ncbi:22480_t:CDS:2 [Racocetra persica]|uniref:22480_t:CDS:1 n=1 Tax=Racocetra persica TaxID=160502 RepID=A0ACA9MP95_9GLOM|nr:22480_t:CDS:2 [Racocetra persica]
MNKGFWLTGGEKFEQPDFKYEKAPNYLELGSNAWDITEAEIIEIEEHYDGQENTGGDTVRPASTSVYIKKGSRVENEATGINYLEPAIKALPSDAIKRKDDDKYCFNSNPKYFDIGLTYPEELGRSGYVMSPSIFPREKSYRGFKFFFHAGEVLEKYEPSHVHVEGHVPSCQIKDKGNMAPSEVAGIKKFLKKNMDKVMDK